MNRVTLQIPLLLTETTGHKGGKVRCMSGFPEEWRKGGHSTIRDFCQHMRTNLPSTVTFQATKSLGLGSLQHAQEFDVPLYKMPS